MHRLATPTLAGGLALAALLVTSTLPALAQVRAQGDRPVMRVLPRPEMYAKLGPELKVDTEAAKSLVLLLEEKGFLLREAVTLLLLAGTRADRVIQEGQFPASQREQVIRTSAERFLDLLEKDVANGWLALAREAGPQVDFRPAVFQANAIIWGVSLQKPLPSRRAKVASVKEVRQPDKVAEKAFPRDVIERNLAGEIGVDVETVKPLLAEVAAEVPLREAVALMVVAGALAERRIAQGEFSKSERAEALRASVEKILPFIEEGEGWGDIGRRMGVPLSGVTVNQKANKILGQP